MPLLIHFHFPLILFSFFFTTQLADNTTKPISHSSYCPFRLPFSFHLQAPLSTSKLPSRVSILGLTLFSFHPRCCIHSKQESDPLFHSQLSQHVVSVARQRVNVKTVNVATVFSCSFCSSDLFSVHLQLTFRVILLQEIEGSSVLCPFLNLNLIFLSLFLCK